jgi:DNA repair exonuclease SbcCD ATPase subunit
LKGSRIRTLTIDGFRGVAGRLELDLDADTVLISGGNGAGKTVITDAIRWCLSGRIPSLEQRQQGEARKFDYVVSAFRPGDKATVTLDLIADGQEIELHRRGNARESTLKIDGAAAASAAHVFEAESEDALREAVGSLAVLGQDVVSDFANGRSDERHMSLRALLGLQRLGEFEEAIQRTVSVARQEAKKAGEQMQLLRQRHQATQQRLDDFRQSVSPAGRDRLLQQARSLADHTGTIAVSLPPEVDADAIGTVAREISGLIEQLVQIAPLSAQLEVELGKPHSEEAVAHAAQNLEKAEARVAALSEQEPWQRLADAALPLLGPTCPVCEQAIEPGAVTRHLHALIDQAGTEGDDLPQARARFEAARVELNAVRANHDRAEAAKASLREALDSWRTSLAGLTYVSVPIESLDSREIAKLRPQAEDLRDRWRDIYSSVAAPSGKAEIEGLEHVLDQLSADVTSAEQQSERLAQRLRAARKAADAAKRACLEITERDLARLEPALRRIYRRLDPHPAFTEIDFQHQFSNTKGRTTTQVEDPRTGTKTNPAVAFSEGQLNATAISLFAALVLTVETPRFPFVLLDDPLQALDGTSALGLAELCRELRKFRQLIVTTHDRRFAALLERKLAAREEGQRNLHLKLLGWQPQGPEVQSHEIPMDEIGQPVLLRAA